MIWTKTGRTVYGNGESTTAYETTDGRLRIESRKKAIPHANGNNGCWMHTSFFLIWDGNEKEFWSLKDANAEPVQEDKKTTIIQQQTNVIQNGDNNVNVTNNGTINFNF